VVVWPVTEAPPKSGSSSDALHRRLGSLVPTYRLHDTTGEDLGLIEHPAPNGEPGDVVMLPDGREALVTARVEAEARPLAALLEVAIARTPLTSDDSIV
jgi:hypothetical protein